MPENLLVGILGYRGSGRSHTWNTLFGRNVRTGKLNRRLYLGKNEYVEVFLVNGSPGERKMKVEKIITVGKPAIVLCSFQYKKSAVQAIDWFIKNDYFLYFHWLNPGYKASNIYIDYFNYKDKIFSASSLFGVRNGKLPPRDRAQEIRDFIYGWAKSRDLIFQDKLLDL
ncbi:MAG: hypothetical protein ABII90_07410 [Bacteroidota bacterium]